MSSWSPRPRYSAPAQIAPNRPQHKPNQMHAHQIKSIRGEETRHGRGMMRPWMVKGVKQVKGVKMVKVGMKEAAGKGGGAWRGGGTGGSWRRGWVAPFRDRSQVTFDLISNHLYFIDLAQGILLHRTIFMSGIEVNVW